MTEDERLGRSLRAIAYALGQSPEAFTYYVDAFERMAKQLDIGWQPTTPPRVDLRVRHARRPGDHEQTAGVFEHAIEMFGPICCAADTLDGTAIDASEEPP